MIGYEHLSSRDIESFLEHPAWMVFELEMKDRLEMLRSELEKGVTVYSTLSEEGELIQQPANIDYAGLRERQGECKSIRWLLDVPVRMKQLKAQEEVNKKKEKKNVSE